MLEIPTITSGLEFTADGIWRSPDSAEVSHPEQCQDWYRAVEEDSFWYRHRAECIVECLRRYPPGGEIVDVGGGNGHVSAAIKRAGFLPVLVEPSAQATAHARARGIETVICSTLDDAGFRDHSLPAVGAFDVLEHIENDVRFAASIHRLLVPSGRLYLTVPAFGILWSSYDEYVGHFRRYTLRSLNRLLSAVGFQVERATYLFGILPLPIFLKRSLPTRLGLRRASDFEHFQQEYAPHRSLLTSLIEASLRLEQARVRGGRNILFGSSCLAVARAL